MLELRLLAVNEDAWHAWLLWVSALMSAADVPKPLELVILLPPPIHQGRGTSLVF